MDRRAWGLCLQFVKLAGIFCAICLVAAPAYSAKFPVSPLWEAANSKSKTWTTYGAQVIDELGDDMLIGARDIETFCPRYYKLNRNNKINAWLFLVSAIVKYESNFVPNDRFEEKDLGLDKITNLPVYSEGLLSLSYQDVLKFPFCDEFDWSRDKKLSPKDPKKTILNPLKNLKCGIQILNYQIRKYQEVAVDDDPYWAVIMPSNVHNKLAKIRALTNAISICKPN